MKPIGNNWICNLRVIATICVVTVHVAAGLLYSCYDFRSLNWWIGNLYDSPLRFCVAIFVMLTGVLLLPQKMDLKTFLKKRFGRILLPFLFWSIVYIIYKLFIEIDKGEQFTIAGVAEFFGFKLLRGASYHLWYVYMIMGLYLFMPILGKWIQNSTQQEIIYFIIVWSIAIIICEFRMLRAITPYYFTGFIGYLVLGYFLANKTFNNIRRLRIVSLLLFFTGAAVTTLGVGYLSIKQGHFNEYLFGNLTPNVAISAVGIFLFIKSLPSITNKIASLVIGFIDRYSFGVYLVHILILDLLDKVGLNAWFIHPAIGIPLTAATCISLSLLTIYLVNKIPVVGKYISG